MHAVARIASSSCPSAAAAARLLLSLWTISAPAIDANLLSIHAALQLTPASSQVQQQQQQQQQQEEEEDCLLLQQELVYTLAQVCPAPLQPYTHAPTIAPLPSENLFSSIFSLSSTPPWHCTVPNESLFESLFLRRHCPQRKPFSATPLPFAARC